MKPRELQHVLLNSPSGSTLHYNKKTLNYHISVFLNSTSLSGKTESLKPKLLSSNSQPQYQAVAPAQSKIRESSQDNFFGFNTKPVKNRGLVGGLYDSLSYLYESVIQDYVESVYTDVIEGYTIATIKVL